jgi:hypothetical protein
MRLNPSRTGAKISKSFLSKVSCGVPLNTGNLKIQSQCIPYLFF